MIRAIYVCNVCVVVCGLYVYACDACLAVRVRVRGHRYFDPTLLPLLCHVIARRRPCGLVGVVDARVCYVLRVRLLFSHLDHQSWHVAAWD